MAAPSVAPITQARQAKLSRYEVKRLAEETRRRELRLKTSIDRQAKLLDRLEARADAFDTAIKTLKLRKEAALSRYEKMENAILADMQARRLEKLIGNERTLSMRANPPKLDVVDQNAIPAGYIREKLVSEPDKMQIKAALARGEEIAGVRLLQSVSLLRK